MPGMDFRIRSAWEIKRTFNFSCRGSRRKIQMDFVPTLSGSSCLWQRQLSFGLCSLIVKSQNFPAYKDNITTYTFSRVANASAGAQLTALVWNNQKISDQLQAVIAKWSHEIDEGLRRTAGGRMPSEWAKKPECWAALSELQLPPPDVMPPGMGTAEVKCAKRKGSARRPS